MGGTEGLLVLRDISEGIVMWTCEGADKTGINFVSSFPVLDKVREKKHSVLFMLSTT